MDQAIIKVWRRPLERGDVPFALRRIYTGINPKTGKELPLQQVLPTVLSDGRIYWEVPDNERNRAHLKAACADVAYTVELPGEANPKAPARK